MEKDETHQLIWELTFALSSMCDYFFSQREYEWEGVEVYEVAQNALNQGSAFLDNFTENKQ